MSQTQALPQLCSGHACRCLTTRAPRWPKWASRMPPRSRAPCQRTPALRRSWWAAPPLEDPSVCCIGRQMAVDVLQEDLSATRLGNTTVNSGVSTVKIHQRLSKAYPSALPAVQVRCTSRLNHRVPCTLRAEPCSRSRSAMPQNPEQRADGIFCVLARLATLILSSVTSLLQARQLARVTIAMISCSSDKCQWQGLRSLQVRHAYRQLQIRLLNMKHSGANAG